MNISTNNVMLAKAGKRKNVANPYTTPGESPKARFNSSLSKNTSANCPWASERAQSLRYDAVLEIEPSTNSIVSIN